MSKKNILLLTIDGIRKDRIGCYNSNFEFLTPNLTRIAKESFVFKDFWASATSTGMCFTSIFTGKYNKEFGRKTYGDNKNPFEENLFRDYEQKGYKTIVCLNKRFEIHSNLVNAFSNAEFVWTGKEMRDSSGKDDSSLRPLEQVEFFSDYVSKISEPTFSWLHLWGFSSPKKEFSEISPVEYDARIAELDHAIGVAFERFKDDYEIYIFSDHGFALFENDQWAYGKSGYSLTESICSIPCMFYDGKTVGENSNLVSQVCFRDLILRKIDWEMAHTPVAYCETRYLEQPDISLAIRHENLKLIHYYDSKKSFFYDLKYDPQENMDYINGKFHRLTRDENGNHPSLKPFVLRTDWENLEKKKNELTKEASGYYGDTFEVNESMKRKVKRLLGDHISL